MFINSLPQNTFSFSLNNKQSKPSQLRLKPQLSADTVSFCGAPPKIRKSFFMEALGCGYDRAEHGLISTAKKFHASLKNVAERLKAFGFEYDEAYNSKSPIKKKQSVLDKYERQGSAQDIIRGTIYWQDQQDVFAFKKFIEEMKNENWVLASLRKVDKETGDFVRNKNGNIIKFPDLEIRQEGLTVESLSPLGEYMQRAEISRPRESTYADWQMRFVSKQKSMKDQSCEVIFLYGPKYKDAKELEHKYVYEPRRKLKKIHVDLNPDHHQKGSVGHTIASNFKEIEKRLIQFISQPLFVNAFNADLKIKDAEKLPVEISKSYANLITSYANGILKAIPSYYSQLPKELLKDENVIASIKAKPAYQFRENKNISKKEITEAKREIREKLSDWKEKDLEQVREVIGDLQETLIKFAAKD